MPTKNDIKIILTHDRQKRQPITAPTQKAGFRVPKTVLWIMEV